MMDARDAATLIGVSPATWHRMVSAGKTPAPVKLSAGCVRWRVADLRSWIDAGCPDRQTWLSLTGGTR
jgi:predicted DNA-binding transcriptional regulator AlpA